MLACRVITSSSLNVPLRLRFSVDVKDPHPSSLFSATPPSLTPPAVSSAALQPTKAESEAGAWEVPQLERAESLGEKAGISGNMHDEKTADGEFNVEVGSAV